jgi:hypothetical protein
MNRRELLTGAAVLAGVGHANAFGLGKLGLNEGHLGDLGSVSTLWRLIFTRAENSQYIVILAF